MNWMIINVVQGDVKMIFDIVEHQLHTGYITTSGDIHLNVAVENTVLDIMQEFTGKNRHYDIRVTAGSDFSVNVYDAIIRCGLIRTKSYPFVRPHFDESDLPTLDPTPFDARSLMNELTEEQRHSLKAFLERYNSAAVVDVLHRALEGK